jgi:hypothetical protein
MSDFTDIVIADDSVAMPRADDITAFRDLVSPIAVLVSPAAGPISSKATIVVDVMDERELALVTLWIEYVPDVGSTRQWEIVYARGMFSPRYQSGSQRAVMEPGLRYRFTITRQGGWPRGTIAFHVEPVDKGGNTPV